MPKKSAAKPLPGRTVIGGKNFTKKGCNSTKKAAKAMADSARSKGRNARVIKDPVTKKYCVFTAKKG